MKLRSLSDILSRMTDIILINTKEISDFSIGSVISSILESFAMELEQYYALTYENIRTGIEEGIFYSFGFNRRKARRAYGEVTLEFNTRTNHVLVLPKGSTFRSSFSGYRQQYETLEDYIIPSDSLMAEVTVYCTESGEIGNIPPSIINSSSSSIPGIRRIYNANSFLTGTKEENLENVKSRFREYIDTRGRATKKSIAYGATTVEDISGVYVHEEIGFVRVYAHDLNGNLPEELRHRVEVAVEDYRPSGINLEISPVVKNEVDVDLEVTVSVPTMKTDAFKDEVGQRVIDYLNSKTANEDLILSDLVQFVMNIDDSIIYDCKILNLKENLYIKPEELIRSGEVRIAIK